MAKTKAQRKRAVAVAKDVLKLIPLLDVGGGGYCNKELPRNFPVTGSAKPLIRRLAKGCNACALGGLVLGYIGIFNKCKLEDIKCSDKHIRLGRSEIITRLKDTFDIVELNQIEAAFEGYGRQGLPQHDPELRHGTTLTMLFYDAYATYESCLTAIMKNIIANNGVFDPTTDENVRKRLGLAYTG